MQKYRGELLILFSTISWGASYLFTKTALKTLSEFNLVALRFTVACIVTALVFNRIARGIGRHEIIYGSRLGTLLFASASLLALGLRTTTVANAGFLVGSMILFVAVMEAAVSRKRPNRGLVAGVLFAVFGIGILTLRGKLSMNPGDVYCLAASMVLAVHVMVAQQSARKANPVGASIVQFATTSVLAWIATSLAGGETVVAPRGDALVAVLALGVVGTAIAFVCQVAGQRYISPTRTAFLFTMEPIFATLFAWLFANEPVTWHVYAGGGLLLAGVYVSEYANPPKA